MGRALSKHMGIFYDLLYYQMVFQKDCTNLKSWSKDSLHTLPLTWPTERQKPCLCWFNLHACCKPCWFNLHACMHAQWFSLVRLSATLWIVAQQAPLSMRILQARILEWVAISFYLICISSLKESPNKISPLRSAICFKSPWLKKARERETNWWRKMMKMNSD